METESLELRPNTNLDNRDGQQIDIFLRKLNKINFRPAYEKLVEPSEGEALTEEEAVSAIEQYRHFLVLHFLYPDRPLIPTRIIDKVWHVNILQTKSYAENCMETFGYFLHHFDSFEDIDAVDNQASKEAFDETCHLLERHFGQSRSTN